MGARPLVPRGTPWASGPIARGPEDFVDQRQLKLHGVGDLPTGVAGRLHRLNTHKGRGIYGGGSIMEAEVLTWPPTLDFRGWLSSPNYSPTQKTDRGRCFGVQEDSHNSRMTNVS